MRAPAQLSFLIALLSLAGCDLGDFFSGSNTVGGVIIGPGPVPGDYSLPQVQEPNLPAPGGKMYSPVRMHLTRSGDLLVSETKQNKVLQVNPETLLADGMFHTAGKPLAVGMLGSEIFVGVKEKQAIEVFLFNGNPAGYLAVEGTIGHPIDLAIDKTIGWLFALDGISGEVQVYQVSDRTLIGTGEYYSPAGFGGSVKFFV